MMRGVKVVFSAVVFSASAARITKQYQKGTTDHNDAELPQEVTLAIGRLAGLVGMGNLRQVSEGGGVFNSEDLDSSLRREKDKEIQRLFTEYDKGGRKSEDVKEIIRKFREDPDMVETLVEIFEGDTGFSMSASAETKKENYYSADIRESAAIALRAIVVVQNEEKTTEGVIKAAAEEGVIKAAAEVLKNTTNTPSLRGKAAFLVGDLGDVKDGEILVKAYKGETDFLTGTLIGGAILEMQKRLGHSFLSEA